VDADQASASIVRTGEYGGDEEEVIGIAPMTAALADSGKPSGHEV